MCKQLALEWFVMPLWDIILLFLAKCYDRLLQANIYDQNVYNKISYFLKLFIYTGKYIFISHDIYVQILKLLQIIIQYLYNTD